jgi:hypothetical protein
MVVDDCCARKKHRAKFCIHSTGDVDVFRTHEEPLIKQTDLAQRLDPEKHETSREVGNIHYPVLSRESKLKALHSFAQSGFERTDRKSSQEESN